jgi:hypothetical protein
MYDPGPWNLVDYIGRWHLNFPYWEARAPSRIKVILGWVITLLEMIGENLTTLQMPLLLLVAFTYAKSELFGLRG